MSLDDLSLAAFRLRAHEFMLRKSLGRKQFARLLGAQQTHLDRWMDTPDMRRESWYRFWRRIQEFIEASEDEEPLSRWVHKP